MKKKFLYAMVVLLMGALDCVAAEGDNGVMWGLKVSIYRELPGKWHTDGDAVTMYSPGVGFSAGVVSNIWLGSNFYFEPGLALTYSQYRYKDLIIMDDGMKQTENPKISKWGIQMPLVVGYECDFSDRFAMDFFTGPQVRYGLSGKVDAGIIDDDDLTNLWNGQRRFDLSWKIGMGVPVNDFVISLEADLGITNLLKNDFTFRENRLGLGISYYF